MQVCPNCLSFKSFNFIAFFFIIFLIVQIEMQMKVTHVKQGMGCWLKSILEILFYGVALSISMGLIKGVFISYMNWSASGMCCVRQ